VVVPVDDPEERSERSTAKQSMKNTPDAVLQVGGAERIRRF